jgi:cytosine/adenosine deaminase-related metal-dependent hydrolase
MTAEGPGVPRVLQAEWLCPVAGPPVHRGWVAIAGGRITAVSGPRNVPPTPAEDLGSVALLPGLVNAHTHLELAPLRGRVPPAPSFTAWVRQLFALRRPDDRPDGVEAERAIAAALEEMWTSGTAVIGDITNSLAAVPLLDRSPLAARVFHELLGFQVTDEAPVRASRAARDALQVGDQLTLGVAPHAPYSVSPELFQAIRREVDRLRPPIMSVHLGESAEEVQLLRDGSGPWRTMLEQIGAWRADWQPPGCRPVEYLDRLGVLAPGTLVVHAVQLTDRELERLAALSCAVVTCPRSNIWVGVGRPPAGRFFASGVAVAIGTDSLASTPDLNMFGELAALAAAAPGVPARRLVESATIVGARALGFDRDYGTIEAGKRASLLAVSVPDGVEDVESYLVGGLHPHQVRWIAS